MDPISSSSQQDLRAAPGSLSESLISAAAEAIDVETVRHLRIDASHPLVPRLAPTLEIHGRLLMASERAYEVVTQRFRALGHVALFRKDGDDDVVFAVPGSLPVVHSRPWLALGLFMATLISVFMAGATAGTFIPYFFTLFDATYGLTFAISLVCILLVHEFAHYLVARRVGIAASLPYFLPLPLGPLGTLGAVIVMKAPPRDRRRLLALGASGPLAGLMVAIPILLIGLSLSPVQALPIGAHYTEEGNSLLYAGLKFLLFGRLLPSGGMDVVLHPMAMAGWVGLLVTGLNLIPAGQLDGGHIAYALMGGRARYLTYGVIAVLLGLSLLWLGWLFWAALIYIFGRVQATPLDDITPLRPFEQALAIVGMVVFVLVFTPIPLTLF